MTLTTSGRIALALVAAFSIGTGAGFAIAKSKYPPVQVLLSSDRTVIGQPISYPAAEPKVTAAIVTMQPGQRTGWHRHDAPLLAYVLTGEITVDYGPDGTKSYKAGDTFLEAYRTEHEGRNSGKGVTRILAVFMGGRNVKNTIPRGGN